MIIIILRKLQLICILCKTKVYTIQAIQILKIQQKKNNHIARC